MQLLLLFSLLNGSMKSSIEEMIGVDDTLRSFPKLPSLDICMCAVLSVCVFV